MAGVTKRVDGATGLLVVSKLVDETRQFEFDVSGKLGDNVTLSNVSTVTAQALGRVSGAEELTISSIEAVSDDAEIHFLAAGGTQNELYRVTCTFTTSASESLVALGAVAVE